jgi:hypothetical protein
MLGYEEPHVKTVLADSRLGGGGSSNRQGRIYDTIEASQAEILAGFEAW